MRAQLLGEEVEELLLLWADLGEVELVVAGLQVRLERGQVPLTFTHRVPKPGSHLVTLIVEPDLPPELRKPGYVVKDHLPIDNRRDFALEVVEALPPPEEIQVGEAETRDEPGE